MVSGPVGFRLKQSLSSQALAREHLSKVFPTCHTKRAINPVAQRLRNCMTGQWVAGLIAIDDPGEEHAGQSSRMPPQCSALFRACKNDSHFRMSVTHRLDRYLEKTSD